MCHDEAVCLEEISGAAGGGAEEGVWETEDFLDASSCVESNALESGQGEVGCAIVVTKPGKLVRRCMGRWP